MATARNIQGRRDLPDNEEHIVADEVLDRERWRWKKTFDAREANKGPATIDISAQEKPQAPPPLRGRHLINDFFEINWGAGKWVTVSIFVLLVVVMCAPKKQKPKEPPQVQTTQQQGTKQKPIPWPYVPK